MASVDPLTITLQAWVGLLMRRSIHGLNLLLKQNDLSMSQIGALFRINHGRSHVSDLGSGLGISTGAASQMLERLVQQELILRSEDPHDRRVKQLLLTDKGRRIMQEILEARQSWLQDLVASLSVAEKEQVAAAINLLIDKTRELDRSTRSESW